MKDEQTEGNKNLATDNPTASSYKRLQRATKGYKTPERTTKGYKGLHEQTSNGPASRLAAAICGRGLQRPQERFEQPLFKQAVAAEG